ncbi:hypothetical protein Clacol_006494 [Clathrus columnatus]|uniref:Glycoside hydrolase family 88 protein n=1 Tax=Clathrus columnatus TaxID=1419009 RepID=A0AAV5AHT6_9AGAM|nr:hypothetical protein Clacol_006494 [Clathrus columnatus]
MLRSIGQKIYQVASGSQATIIPTTFPEYTAPDHTWVSFPLTTWTDGFFASALYLLDTRAKLCRRQSEFDWVSLGRTWSTGLLALENIDPSNLDHDVGFLSYPFQKELLVNPANITAQNAIIKLAIVLANRFNPIVGCTRSWNTADPTNFQVSDTRFHAVSLNNMMNLELLFVAADLTGNQTFRDIAKTHADTTIKNHFRPDGSTWHVVEYNSTTGIVIQKITAQGYANNSTWTRGQSWAIYGYANMYNRTGLTQYLDTARRAATLYVDRLPQDDIVPWDFDAPRPTTADTSSSTIAASGMLLLADMEENLFPPNYTGAAFWRQSAIKLLTATNDFAWAPPSWQSLLSNGTVNNRADPPMNDTGIVYADHYWIEAGNRLISNGLAPCPEVGL